MIDGTQLIAKCRRLFVTYYLCGRINLWRVNTNNYYSWESCTKGVGFIINERFIAEKRHFGTLSRYWCNSA